MAERYVSQVNLRARIVEVMDSAEYRLSDKWRGTAGFTTLTVPSVEQHKLKARTERCIGKHGLLLGQDAERK